MRIIALSNQKGGVGKTTTSVNLGAYLAAAGQRVLVLDLDPQANATSTLGVVPGSSPTIYDSLVDGVNPADLVVQTKLPNLSLIPSHQDLAGVEVELARADDHLIRLRSVLHQYRPFADFDFMLVDCPPSLGILMTGALAATDQLLIPVQCEYFGIEGLAKMLQLIDQIKESGANPELYIEGIVMTMADSRTNLTEYVINDVRSGVGDMAYNTVIPRSVKLGEAPSHEQTILEYAPQSKGAIAYQALCNEFLLRHEAATRAAAVA